MFHSGKRAHLSLWTHLVSVPSRGRRAAFGTGTLVLALALPQLALAQSASCGKLTCKHRNRLVEPAVDGTEVSETGSSLSRMDIEIGVGGGMFALPDVEMARIVSVNTLEERPIDVSGIQSAGFRRSGVAGAPLVTLGLGLRQPLAPEFVVPLHLEEHFSAFALRPAIGDSGQVLGGRADFLLGFGVAQGGISLALGLTAGALDISLDEDVEVDPLLLMFGPVLRLGFDIEDLPGWRVNVAGHQGSLFPGGDYASAELALAIGL